MASLRLVLYPTGSKKVELDTVLTSPSNRILLYNPNTNEAFYAGYSIARQINSGYTGYLIKVRRESDNALMEVGFDVNGDLDVTSLETWLGKSDGYLHTLYDQGDYMLDFTQSENSRQPKIANSGTVITDPDNSKPACYNTKQYDVNLVCPIMKVIQPAYYFMVCHPTSNVEFAHFLDGNYIGSRHIIGYASNKIYVFAGLDLAGDAWTDASTLVYARINGANSEVGKNGAAAATGNAGTDNLGSALLLSGRRVSGGLLGEPEDHWVSVQGYFQELMIYSNPKKMASRSTVESGINAYYSIY